MTYKEIVDLIKLVNKTDLTEVNIKEGEFRLSIRNKDFHSSKGLIADHVSHPIAYQTAPPTPTPVMAAPQVAQEAKTVIPDLPAQEEKPNTGNLIEVKSPIVGTFYRSSSPDKAAYVKVGDTIEVGSVVCIVEAMKLFNEIESEVSGKVVKVMVEDASPVEYDQVLFLVDPS